MFHFQTLDVYRCAIAFLPKAYALSKVADSQPLSRSYSTSQKEPAASTARRSTLECAAVLDAMKSLGIDDIQITEGSALLVRVVSMLTKMIA